MNITNLWYSNSTFRIAWIILFFPLSLVYLCIVYIRRKISRPLRINGVSVISIGNITVGGTGKTPMAIEIAKILKNNGKKVGIFTRAYREGKVGVFTEKNKNIILDEARTILENIKGSTVFISKHRYENICKNSNNIDVAVLDDAFQYLKIKPDVNILLINVRQKLIGNLVIPAGTLREPSSSIKYADCVIFTHANLVKEEVIESLKFFITKKAKKSIHFFKASLVTKYFVNVNKDEIPLERLQGKRVIAFSGVASNNAFLKTLERIGLNVKNFF